MEVKHLQAGLTSKKMPASNDRNYVYHIPMIENMEEDECCSKRVRQIAKFMFCFIPWCAMVIIFIYFAIHYDMLYKTSDKCKETLIDKSRNESVARAQLGELKQKNAELNKDVKELQRKLQQAEDRYQNAQDKIDLYLKTIKELKENLNLQISTDFLTNPSSSASTLIETSYYFVIIMLSAIIYIFQFKSYI